MYAVQSNALVLQSILYLIACANAGSIIMRFRKPHLCPASALFSPEVMTDIS